ncbi:hypothetical protein IWQ57_001882 [Coemansia nantahalensis]|uniref:Uncharacterized protein n=2 Tax=Coemansia TaxID=4863 RepID=A0ACC1KW09_9FUNG|nr:hypothetical protein IWQ57_001882 [Coemansia nantahalensis]KAJ2796121.1 hypothetical protein H4R21_004837 [Coemansia helicoidea]
MPRQRLAADGLGDDLMSESFDALNFHVDDDDGGEGDERGASQQAQSPGFISITSSPPTNPPSLSQVVIDLSRESTQQPPLAAPSRMDAQSPAGSDAGSPAGSPGRKHRRDTRLSRQASQSAEGSKRPRLDPDAPPAAKKAGLAAMLNPEPGAGDEAAEPPRSRVLFKCAVCLDRPDPAVFMQACGHVFCEGCAQCAVQSTMRCPVCRHGIHMRDIRVLQFRVAKVRRQTA